MKSTLTERITRLLAFMLRHQPEQFDIEVDAHGFADLDDVVDALSERVDMDLTRDDIVEAIDSGDRPRYEIDGHSIRALYGHSIAVEPGEPSKPPELLYVGLPAREAERAARYGLRGGRRRFLHLALTEDDAVATGQRSAREYAVVTIQALDAWEDGINFYDRKSLFLAEEIPTHLIEVGSTRTDGVDSDDRERGRGRGERRSRGGRGRGRGRDRDDDEPRDEEPRRERAPRERDDRDDRDDERGDRDRDRGDRDGGDGERGDRAGGDREGGDRDRDRGERPRRGRRGGRGRGRDDDRRREDDGPRERRPRRERAPARAEREAPEREERREPRRDEPTKEREVTPTAPTSQPAKGFGLGVFEEKKKKSEPKREPRREPRSEPKPAREAEPARAAPPEPKEPERVEKKPEPEPRDDGPAFGAGV